MAKSKQRAGRRKKAKVRVEKRKDEQLNKQKKRMKEFRKYMEDEQKKIYEEQGLTQPSVNPQIQIVEP